MKRKFFWRDFWRKRKIFERFLREGEFLRDFWEEGEIFGWIFWGSEKFLRIFWGGREKNFLEGFLGRGKFLANFCGG